MECKVTTASAAMNEVFCDTVVEQPIETEFTLPDYCPDIGKILKCRAVPGIVMRSINGEQLNIEGMVKLEVIYVDGRDKHLRCCEHSLPFTVKLPLSGCPENAAASVSVQTEYVNCRAVSQRRVDIRGALSVHVRASAQNTVSVISDAEGAGVRVRRRNTPVSTCAGRTQSAFTISESLELSDGKPPIASVVRSSASLRLNECKPIANKLIVKGEAAVRVVYTAEPEGRVEAMEYTLPFNQFLDMPGADDECMTDCRLEVSSMDIGLRTDPDGEYRRMSVDIRAFADVTAYRNAELSVISDAYSVECELDTERRYMNFERFCGCFSAQAAAEAGLDAGRELAQVLDSWCEPVKVSAEVSGGKAHVSGKMQLCAIARCDDGDCEFIEKTVPFECDTAVPDNIENGRAVSNVSVRSCNYTMLGASKINVRAELAAEVSLYDGVQLQCVSSIVPDTGRLKKRGSEPALVVYFAEAGEELWDIARELNASVETIQSENDISELRLAEDRMLLISVR